MNAPDFINLNRKMGHTIIQNNDLYAWLVRGNGTIIAIPSLETCAPDVKEFGKVVSSKNRMATFITDRIVLNNSFEYELNTNSYNLSMVDSKTRNQIRKGLKSCIVRDCTLDDMVTQAILINQITLTKQSRSVSYLESPDRWGRYIDTLLKHPDVLVKGAFVEDKLIAYIILIKVCSKYYIYHPFMDFKYSSLCPMNALLYVSINEILNTCNHIRVSYGLSSYLEKPGLDKFKKSMLFDEITRTRIVVFHKSISVLVDDSFRFIVFMLCKLKLLPIHIIDKYDYLIQAKKDYYSYVAANHP